MKKHLFLFSSILSLWFASCTKDKTHSPEAQNEILTSGETDTYPPEADPWSSAQNTSNPLDANGYYHNSDLDYIFGNIGTDSSHSNLYDQSLDYIGVQFGTTIQSSTSSAAPFNNVNPYFTVVDSFTVSALKNHVNGSGLRTIVKSELNALIDILTDTLSSDYTTNYDSLKTRIVDWEASISRNSSLLNAEKDGLLRAGSVARYSTLYWKNYDDTYIEGLPSKPGWFKRWLGWALVGAADAIGFVTGSAMGSPVAGILVAGAGSAAGFVIFRERGWEP